MTNLGRASPWFKIPKIRSVLSHPSLSILGSIIHDSNMTSPILGPHLPQDSVVWGGGRGVWNGKTDSGEDALAFKLSVQK